MTRAAARKARKAAEAGVASDSAGVAPEAMATMTLKTDVVSACGGLRSASSMAVMPRLHRSTYRGDNQVT